MPVLQSKLLRMHEQLRPRKKLLLQPRLLQKLRLNSPLSMPPPRRRQKQMRLRRRPKHKLLSPKRRPMPTLLRHKP